MLAGHDLCLHEHIDRAGAGWGDPAMKEGVWKTEQLGCYCMFCLFSHQCATEIEISAINGRFLFVLCLKIISKISQDFSM